jgi:hypothetical protein
MQVVASSTAHRSPGRQRVTVRPPFVVGPWRQRCGKEYPSTTHAAFPLWPCSDDRPGAHAPRQGVFSWPCTTLSYLHPCLDAALLPCTTATGKEPGSSHVATWAASQQANSSQHLLVTATCGLDRVQEVMHSCSHVHTPSSVGTHPFLPGIQASEYASHHHCIQHCSHHHCIQHCSWHACCPTARCSGSQPRPCQAASWRLLSPGPALFCVYSSC